MDLHYSLFFAKDLYAWQQRKLLKDTRGKATLLLNVRPTQSFSLGNKSTTPGLCSETIPYSSFLSLRRSERLGTTLHCLRTTDRSLSQETKAHYSL